MRLSARSRLRLPCLCPRPLRRPGRWCTVRRVQPDAESRGSAPAPPRLGPWEPPERRGDVRARAPSIASDSVAATRTPQAGVRPDQRPRHGEDGDDGAARGPVRDRRTLSAAGICLADRDSDSGLDPRGRGLPRGCRVCARGCCCLHATPLPVADGCEWRTEGERLVGAGARAWCPADPHLNLYTQA